MLPFAINSPTLQPSSCCPYQPTPHCWNKWFRITLPIFLTLQKFPPLSLVRIHPGSALGWVPKVPFLFSNKFFFCLWFFFGLVILWHKWTVSCLGSTSKGVHSEKGTYSVSFPGTVIVTRCLWSRDWALCSCEDWHCQRVRTSPYLETNLWASWWGSFYIGLIKVRRATLHVGDTIV